jgi:porphobilinogen synthase
MHFPILRARRLRKKERLRELIKETHLNLSSFIYPMFVSEEKEKKEISSMLGIFRHSLNSLLYEVEEILKLKLNAVLLFGIPKKKDEKATEAYNENGIIQKAVKKIKKTFPELLVITDCCLCEYTSSGHCGVVKKKGKEWFLDNDLSLKLLQKTAVSQSLAGADIIAPSSMLDGQVMAIREALDKTKLCNVPIMSYSTKYASSFYGPFRDAADSSPKFSNRKTYQIDPANVLEGIKESRLDIEEGADIIMVKPALSYLDVISHIREISDIPLAAYNVIGEYSMVKAAASKGWIDEKNIVLEILTSMKRAGADIIISYHSKDVAKWISKV